MNKFVPVGSFFTISFALICGFAIPAIFAIVGKKYFGGKKKPFFTGCIVFLLFALILENIFKTVFFIMPFSMSLISKPILLCFIGALFAGVFEEVGRFAAYKTVLKNTYDDDSTALMYGAGHGGFEVFFILVSTMATNLFFSIIVNTQTADKIISDIYSSTGMAIYSVFQKLVATSPWTYLLSVFERLVALALHISLSVILWFGVKNKKNWYLVLVAVALHTLVDFVAGIMSTKGWAIWQMELMLFVMSLVVSTFAYALWKLFHKKVEIVQTVQNEI